MLSLLQCESFGKPEQESRAITPSSSAMVCTSAERREKISQNNFSGEFSGSQSNTEMHPETSLPRPLSPIQFQGTGKKPL